MMKRWLLCVMLTGVVTGCRMFEPRPTPDTCPEPAPVPTVPPLQSLPPGGSPPPGATQVVVGLCPATGEFLAAGINRTDTRFTYLVKGDRTVRDSFLANVYKSGVPVVLYTSPVKVLGAGTAALTAETGSGEEEPPFDPCDRPEIGEEPPEDPKDQGGAVPKPVETFTKLAWRSANAVDSVSDPAPPSSTQPAPRTDVPR